MSTYSYHRLAREFPDRAIVSQYSPRLTGQHAAQSVWAEVPYAQFAGLSAAERAHMCAMAVRAGMCVWVRTAAYHHARIFVLKSGNGAIQLYAMAAIAQSVAHAL